MRLHALLALVPVAASTARALSFTTSWPSQCRPLNITWPVESSRQYPFTVAVMANGFAAQTYNIESSYQSGASELTFQWDVPPPSGAFSSGFVVSVADALGAGNTSQLLVPDTRESSNANCTPYGVTTAFNWAADNTGSGALSERASCTPVRYYPVGSLRGTRPFTITMAPFNGLPISITVPDSSTQNISYFIHNLTVPFNEGTSFITMLGDATGSGSGGSSPVATVRSNSTSCIGRTVANAITRAIPVGALSASFRNAAGALTQDEANALFGGSPSSSAGTPGSTSGSSNSGSGGGGTNGALVGGIIGAVIAVAVIVAALVAFLIYRRRQRAKRDMARKEQPQFIDLDGDEDGPGSSAALAARRGRNSGGISQSYAPTPFTYDPAANGSSPDLAAAYRDEPLRAPTRPGSFSGQSGRGAGGSISGMSAAGLRYPPSPGTALSDGGRSGWQGTSTMHGSEAGADFMSATSHGPGSVAAGSAYRLSARNAEPAGDAPPLPVKGALPGDDANVGSSSRFIQHSDAGPITPAQPAEDAVEELPPSYGGWAGNPRAAAP